MDTCLHPELMSWYDAFPGNWHYRCKMCGKSAIIPVMTILMEEDSNHSSHWQANHAARQRMVALVGQTFGERWQEEMQRESDRWEAKELAYE